jgi:hypothetical protein
MPCAARAPVADAPEVDLPGRRRRLRVSASVAGVAGGDDVPGRAATAVAPGIQVFGGAAQRPRLSSGETRLARECAIGLLGRIPHRVEAVEAEIALRARGAGTLGRQRHGGEPSAVRRRHDGPPDRGPSAARLMPMPRTAGHEQKDAPHISAFVRTVDSKFVL